ncbi:UNVERIFIED_CONTAM: hypothetical protein Slati_3427700 [Sesamum latifolium]|uniref:Retrotransposon gag domain-containing protein n=1 Tax=Sesamum latifolium TaxID=2727402 RepID=A0AAW2UGQ4_9LAMI
MELSPTLLGTLQQMITSAIREQLTVLALAQVTPQPEVVVPEQADPTLAIPGPEAVPGPAKQLPSQAGDVPLQWLARLEYLQKGLQDVQYQVGAPAEEETGILFTEEVMADKFPVNCRTPAIAEYDGTIDPQEHLSRFENATLLHRYTDGIKCLVCVTTFARAAQQWFNQLPPAMIGSFREFHSLFPHQFASSRKHRKTELSLFSIRQKEGKSLKDYLQRFNTAALEVPSANQEVKDSAFAQGLMDGDFFKSLAKKPSSSQVHQHGGRLGVQKRRAGEKRKETKDENPFKKPRMDFKDKKPAWQKVNMVYTPLTVPITQALMAVEGKCLLSRPRSYKDGSRQPKSDKFYRFHNDMDI